MKIIKIIVLVLGINSTACAMMTEYKAAEKKDEPSLQEEAEKKSEARYNPLVIANIGAAGYCAYRAGTALYKRQLSTAVEQVGWGIMHIGTARLLYQKKEVDGHENSSLINFLGFARAFYTIPLACPEIAVGDFTIGTTIALFRLINGFCLAPDLEDETE